VPKKLKVIFFLGGVGSNIIIFIEGIYLSNELLTPSKADLWFGCAKNKLML
jgi:hypothetical protein